MSLKKNSTNERIFSVLKKPFKNDNFEMIESYAKISSSLL